MNTTANSRVLYDRRAAGYAALIFTAVLWGVAFVPQRHAMRYTGPFTFNAIRFFCGGALVFGFAAWRQFGALRTMRWRPAIFLGALLFVSSTFQQIGMVSTTAGKGGFITGLYIVLVPVLLTAFWRQRIARNCWLGAALALAGLGFLTLTEGLSLSAGDAWILACAFGFALHTIFVGKLARELDPLLLAAGQYFTCALFSGIASLSERQTWPTTPQAAPELFYMSLFSIGIAYTLQVVGQRYVPAANAAIVLGLESVFAALAGCLLLGETLTGAQTLGCALMFTATIVAQAPMVKS